MEASPEEQQVPIIKPRNPTIAFFLALFIPGLGQVYNGQFKKGFLFFCLTLLIQLIFGWTRWVTEFNGLCALVIVQLIFRLFMIIDAVIYARRQKEYEPKKYNTWYKHLLYAIVALVIYWSLDLTNLLGAKTFSIPSTANNPTLQVNDRVVADMQAYDNAKPDYGDLIVFKKPDGIYYPGRIVGLPNDTLEIINDIISVNGKICKTNFVKETTTKFAREMTIETIPILEIEEEFPNGHKHHIYKFKQPFDTTMRTVKNIVVPPNCYYFMGDNRDNALDSRYIGPISIQVIEGRIIYSYWGDSKERINIDFRNN